MDAQVIDHDGRAEHPDPVVTGQDYQQGDRQAKQRMRGVMAEPLQQVRTGCGPVDSNLFCNSLCRGVDGASNHRVQGNAKCLFRLAYHRSRLVGGLSIELAFEHLLCPEVAGQQQKAKCPRRNRGTTQQFGQGTECLLHLLRIGNPNRRDLGLVEKDRHPFGDAAFAGLERLRLHGYRRHQSRKIELQTEPLCFVDHVHDQHGR